MRVLVIEDDAETADYIVKGLEELGHSTDHASDGMDGLVLGKEDYDVMIVDRMLPGIDGLRLVRLLREDGVATPVLFLTNLGSVEERVRGLQAGGDDYLQKPFAFSELAARVQALVRRPALSQTETMLKTDDLEMDLLSHTVTRGNERIELQPREFQLLKYLMQNEGRVVTRTMLLEQVWGYHFNPKTSVVETHISRLRNKIETTGTRPLLHTIRGSGYKFGVES